MNEIVKYRNKMNEISFRNFTQKDIDFFMAICSQLKEKGTLLVELDFDTIKRLIEYVPTSRERFVAELDRMSKKLDDVNIRYETEEEIVRFHVFQSFHILKTRDIVKIKLNSEFKDYLNNLFREITQFPLSEFVNLDSMYSKELYRQLKQWRVKGHCPTEYEDKYFTIEEIKNLFNTPDYEPKRLREFILDPAVKELNKKGYFKNLVLNIHKAKKRGSPVLGYSFSFSPEKTFNSKNNSKEHKNNKKDKINKFNDFPQREYTKDEFEEMEKKLLEKSYDFN